MSTDPGRPYRVELLHTARARIKQCGEQAIRLGIVREYAATLRTIIENLSLAPLNWGDPIRDYKSAKLHLYRRVFGQILTEYAVHEKERIVYIKEYKPVFGHPLESTS
jgi:hypothetical protein